MIRMVFSILLINQCNDISYWPQFLNIASGASLGIKKSLNEKLVATNRNISYCKGHTRMIHCSFLPSTNKSFLIILLVRSLWEVIYVLCRKSDKLHTPPGRCIFAWTYIGIHKIWYYLIKSKKVLKNSTSKG